MTKDQILEKNSNAKSLRDLCEVVFDTVQLLHTDPTFSLPERGNNTPYKSLRWTPRFSVAPRPYIGSKAYTMVQVAKFLGRLQDRGKGVDKADDDIRTAFSFLSARENNLITTDFLLSELTEFSRDFNKQTAKKLRKAVQDKVQ